MDPLQPGPAGAAPSAEQRLALLTEECADVVRRWALTSERHARAVTRFEAHLAEWNEAGERLQQNATERIHGLEKLIQEEWNELKQLHDEPVRRLSEHATSLTQVCIATASVAQQGFERSEARLTAIEGELNRRLNELTREVQAVVAELRSGALAPARLPGPPQQSWSLEGVTRLHQQLRGEPALPDVVDPPASRPAPALLPEAASVITERIDTLEKALSERDDTVKEAAARSARSWRLGVAVLASLVFIGSLITVGLRRDMREATAQAEQARQAQAQATAEAARQTKLVQEAAERQVAAANERAARAQLVVDVLAAPDLASYPLTGRRALAGRAAIVRWSPSRGVVFSGSQVPPPPERSTYQLWLRTRTGGVSAGTFTPDPAGAVTLATAPPQGAASVFGAFVTIEPEVGRTSPLGEVVFNRPLPVVPAANTP